MNCPGQSTGDLFYFSLYNQPQYLDLYNNVHGARCRRRCRTTPVQVLRRHAQLEPAPAGAV